MCVNCFIDGKQDDKFPRTNSYHVLNRLNFPIYDEQWTAEEEILLLEGMEKYGFGNWGDIADHISTDKTWEDVANHYEKVYVTSVGSANTEEILSQRDENQNLIIKQTDGATKTIGEIESKKKKGATKQVEKKNQFTGSQKTLPMAGLVSKDNGMNAADVVGYMPLRGDFDYEYDNEAELFLAELEFNGKWE